MLIPLLLCLLTFGCVVLSAIAVQVLAIRGLARAKCLTCGQRFGIRSALRGKIILRIMHEQWEGLPFLEPVAFRHVRSVTCLSCNKESLIDAKGNDHSGV